MTGYISNGQLRDYLEFVQEKELIEFDEQSQLYKLTSKGLNYVKIYVVKELFTISETKNQPPIPLEKPVSVFAE